MVAKLAVVPKGVAPQVSHTDRLGGLAFELSVTQTRRSIFTHRMRAGNSDCLKDLVFVDVTLLETKRLPASSTFRTSPLT
jgi:hypothetical protein